MERGSFSGNADDVSVRSMTSVDALTYGDMVFAKLRGEMLRLQADGLLQGYVADADGMPAGVVMVRRDGVGAEVESLFVKAAYRGRGIAGKLLRAVEQQLLAEGDVQQMRITYFADRPTTAALEQTLARLGWDTPEGDMILCQVDASVEGWKMYGESQGESAAFTLFPWSELTTEDREWIETTQAETPWIPDDLYPLQFENCEPVNSLGIRHKGRPVGWVLTHRVAPDVIRWTCSYMHPEYQRQARILPAYREAFRLQKEAGISKLIFLVPFKHRGMLRWVLRWWPEEFRQVKTSRRCSKTLHCTLPLKKETHHVYA